MIANRLYALREAAKPSGFTPQAFETKEFMVALETEGLVRQSNNHPFWIITDKGRDELAKLEATR